MSISTITLNGNPVSLVAVPAKPGLRSFEPTINDAIAVVDSPFTGQQQTQAWAGADRLAAMMVLPPLSPAQADDWIAFLMECRGMQNAFLIGDPMKTAPRGSVAGNSAPVVDMAPVATNFLQQSQAFSGAPWVANQLATETDNTVAAPDGSMTAGFLQAIASPTDAYLAQVVRGLGGLTVTFSVYMRVPSSSPSHPVKIQINDGVTDSVTSCSLTTTWQRFSVTHTVPAFSDVTVYIGGGGSVTDANEGLNVAWAQLESGSVAGTYINTDGNPAPRANFAGSQVLSTRGWHPNGFGLLVPGDNLQIGYRLHKVLDRVNSDSNGRAVLSIWPSLREVPTDGQQVILNNPKGLFRLAKNQRGWASEYTRVTSISFPVTEYR